MSPVEARPIEGETTMERVTREMDESHRRIVAANEAAIGPHLHKLPELRAAVAALGIPTLTVVRMLVTSIEDEELREAPSAVAGTLSLLLHRVPDEWFDRPKAATAPGHLGADAQAEGEDTSAPRELEFPGWPPPDDEDPEDMDYPADLVTVLHRGGYVAVFADVAATRSLECHLHYAQEDCPEKLAEVIHAFLDVVALAPWVARVAVQPGVVPGQGVAEEEARALFNAGIGRDDLAPLRWAIGRMHGVLMVAEPALDQAALDQIIGVITEVARILAEDVEPMCKVMERATRRFSGVSHQLPHLMQGLMEKPTPPPEVKARRDRDEFAADIFDAIEAGGLVAGVVRTIRGFDSDLTTNSDRELRFAAEVAESLVMLHHLGKALPRLVVVPGAEWQVHSALTFEDIERSYYLPTVLEHLQDVLRADPRISEGELEMLRHCINTGELALNEWKVDLDGETGAIADLRALVAPAGEG